MISGWIFSVVLPSELPKLRTDPACERSSYCVEASPPRLPSQDRSPSPNPMSPFFCLYFLPYLIPRRLVCLYGHLGSSASIQNLFCGSCSTCTWYIWEGEGGLPILFLCHLGTVPFSTGCFKVRYLIFTILWIFFIFFCSWFEISFHCAWRCYYVW